MVLTIVALSFTSCGDESEDPQPVKPEKTNMELVKEGVVGSWTFVSAEITKDGTTLTYTAGSCNYSGQPSWFQANARDVNYSFITDKKASKHRNCSNETFNDLSYTIKEVSGKFTLEVSDGSVFELVTAADDLKTSTTVKVKGTALQDATSVVFTFKKA